MALSIGLALLAVQGITPPLKHTCRSGAKAPEELVTVKLVAWIDNGIHPDAARRRDHVKRHIEAANKQLLEELGYQFQVLEYKDYGKLDCNLQPEPQVIKFADDPRAKGFYGKAFQHLFTSCWDSDGKSGPTNVKGAATTLDDVDVLCEESIYGVSWMPRIDTPISSSKAEVFLHEMAHKFSYRHDNNGFPRWNSDESRCKAFTKIQELFAKKPQGNGCVSKTKSTIPSGTPTKAPTKAPTTEPTGNKKPTSGDKQWGGKRCRSSTEEEGCNNRKNCKWLKRRNFCRWNVRRYKKNSKSPLSAMISSGGKIYESIFNDNSEEPSDNSTQWLFVDFDDEDDSDANANEIEYITGEVSDKTDKGEVSDITDKPDLGEIENILGEIQKIFGEVSDKTDNGEVSDITDKPDYGKKTKRCNRLRSKKSN